MKLPVSPPRPTCLSFQVTAVLLAIGMAGAQTPLASIDSSLQPGMFPLEPVFGIKEVDGRHRFITRQEVRFDRLKTRLDNPVFFAVVTNDWPTGLVPLFAVEKPHGIELRRRALAGEENTSDPLFFALPPEDEPDAAKIAGRWECRAVRGSGSRDFLIWELAVDQEKISGRFSQDTEYRVAYVAGGTFRSNQFELRVEYLQDAYVLRGDWRDGKLKGDWRRSDDEERGSWEAAREPSQPPARGEIVRLYEWRRASDNGRHYAVEGEKLAEGWERSPRPLCRVWRLPSAPKPH